MSTKKKHNRNPINTLHYSHLHVIIIITQWRRRQINNEQIKNLQPQLFLHSFLALSFLLILFVFLPQIFLKIIAAKKKNKRKFDKRVCKKMKFTANESALDAEHQILGSDNFSAIIHKSNKNFSI